MTKVLCAIDWCVNNSQGACTKEEIHLSEEEVAAFPNELDCQEFERE